MTETLDSLLKSLLLKLQCPLTLLTAQGDGLSPTQLLFSFYSSPCTDIISSRISRMVRSHFSQDSQVSCRSFLFFLSPSVDPIPLLEAFLGLSTPIFSYDLLSLSHSQTPFFLPQCSFIPVLHNSLAVYRQFSHILCHLMLTVTLGGK